jgi:uncharacterized protein YbjT (DUF2867 family)
LAHTSGRVRDRTVRPLPVLVAGATGALGRALVVELQRRGQPVRALARDRSRAAASDPPPAEVVAADLTDERSDLVGACRGVETVISVAGQSTATHRLRDRRGFQEVDYEGNVRLVEAAKAAGSRRFLYVSVFDAARLAGLEYVDAHERVVDRLGASELEPTIVRANGFFSAYRELLEMAAAGRRIPLFANGEARSNPIHEGDLATVCLDALEAGTAAIDVGGPEILTRRQEIDLAFEAVGREPRTARMHPRVASAASAVLRLVDRRRAATIAFLAAVNQIDMIAPRHGERRLGDYLTAYAADLRAR